MGAMAPIIKKNNISIYIGINFSNFVFIKFILCTPLNNIIDYFKSNIIVTNFSITFLQITEVINSYWSASRLICNSNIFFILKGIKKFINLKFKTKYTSPKKLAQQQKLQIIA